MGYLGESTNKLVAGQGIKYTYKCLLCSEGNKYGVIIGKSHFLVGAGHRAKWLCPVLYSGAALYTEGVLGTCAVTLPKS